MTLRCQPGSAITKENHDCTHAETQMLAHCQFFLMVWSLIGFEIFQHILTLFFCKPYPEKKKENNY